MPLLSYEEYNKAPHPRPYIVKIGASGQYLYYFGESHSHDLELEQWSVLKDLWAEFLLKSERAPRIAIVEGGVSASCGSEKKAILRHSGKGLLSFLAHKSDIPLLSPEPDERSERVMLENKFSKEEIQYYYFARVVAQWNRRLEPRQDFESYISEYLEDDRKASGWTDFDFSLNNMKEIHAKLFSIPFDEKDARFFEEICRPTSIETRVNQVSRAVGDNRDNHIAREIVRIWNEGKSIFGVYGATHVIRQESLLRELLK